jgi:ubiquinone/menaquinone biosynthesis C-methylase UbiE
MTNGNSLNSQSLGSYWSKWAKVWDPLLSLVGLDRKYRKQAISVLDLAAGMTILDIACGTGFNFPYLIEAVSPEGRIIAIDVSQGMLTKASLRAQKNGWENIEFLQGDVSNIHLPKANAAVAFWCMVSIPDYQKAMDNIISSLLTGGGLAVLDFKQIDGFPGPLLNPTFGSICRLTHQDIHRKPWIYLEKILHDVQMREWKLGWLWLADVYLAWGHKS